MLPLRASRRLPMPTSRLLRNHLRKFISPKSTCEVHPTENWTHRVILSQTQVTMATDMCSARCSLWVSKRSLQTRSRSCNTSDVIVNDSTIEVVHEGRNLRLNNVWLRDHCRCEKCYAKSTDQREFDILTISLDIAPENVKLEGTKGESQLHVQWPDGHHSEYSLDWLKNNYGTGTDQSEWSKQLKLWDARTVKKDMPVAVSFDEYLKDDEKLKTVLQNLVTYGFAFVKDTPATIEDTQKVAERISFIRETLYGKMWSFSADHEYADSSYSNQALRAHTDTSYFNEPAGIQVFHCLEHSGDGGETLLVDGFNAAHKLKDQHPEFYQILSEVRLNHCYIDHINNLHTEGRGPILHHHPITNELMCIRFNTYDRGTITHLDTDQLTKFYNALVAYAKEVATPANELWIKLWPGNVLMVDNWRLLHGRSSYTGYRQVCGCYLPRDDLHSRYRTLLGIQV